MTAPRSMADRMLTIAAFLAIPVMMIALWNTGQRAIDSYASWQVGRIRRSLVDSITMNTPERTVLGSRQSKHAILELMDYQCPACRTADSLMSAAMPSGASAWSVVVLHLPLSSIHPLARNTAIASVCAERQQHLREFHHTVYREATPEGLAADWALAKRVGVPDSAAFAVCVASPDASRVVDRDLALAMRLAAKGTPTFFSERGEDLPLGVVLQMLTTQRTVSASR